MGNVAAACGCTAEASPLSGLPIDPERLQQLAPSPRPWRAVAGASRGALSTIQQGLTFPVGTPVEARDASWAVGKWVPGAVTSTYPLKVRLEGWDTAHSWDSVRPLSGERRSPARARAPPPRRAVTPVRSPLAVSPAAAPRYSASPAPRGQPAPPARGFSQPPAGDGGAPSSPFSPTAAQAAAAAHDADMPPIGANVEVFGLQKYQEINGQVGTVARYRMTSTNGIVLVVNVGPALGERCLLPENCRVVGPQGGAQSPHSQHAASPFRSPRSGGTPQTACSSPPPIQEAGLLSPSGRGGDRSKSVRTTAAALPLPSSTFSPEPGLPLLTGAGPSASH